MHLLSVVLQASSPSVILYQDFFFYKKMINSFGLHLKSGIFGIIIIVTFRLAERIRGRVNFYIQTLEMILVRIELSVNLSCSHTAYDS